MLRKAVVVICDGLADRPVPELGNLTPLEAARTPNLDKLAFEGECGMMHTLGRGKIPGSDTAHLMIFGYDIATCYSGRGPIEVAGLGMELRDGDVALRGNMGTVVDGIITDRRAGRIRVVTPLCEALDGMKIGDVEFVVKPGTAHRAGVIIRGKGLSDAIIDADPHIPDVPIREVTLTDNSPEAKKTADVLNKFLAKAHEVLSDHPFNKERVANGDLPANYLLVRGSGQYKEVESFKEKYDLTSCCIAGGGLYKGIGAFLGMDILDVPGATALPDTDIEAKFKLAVESVARYDFVFVHVKAADSLGEDGDFKGKKEFIEKIDLAVPILSGLPKDTLMVWTADHSTPCEMKAHSADPVPVLFHGGAVRADRIDAFNERACTCGGLGYMNGLDLMPEIQNLLGKLHLVGA
ncbi:MAG: phosphoglycerate mutase [Candidatus Zixiibacteriota bacterium]|nr:MAG: phosphoglycerate mutase [candidate division Zixibacteria bacterium]